ncbi:MAG TPA: hypothetical protein VIY96_11120 [Thermoanaerobaculia bacterium]
MKVATRIVLLAVGLLSGCASSREPSAAAPTLLSPEDLVASLADVASGRNADLAETGLVLKTIELKLVVGRERTGGAHASFLVLDAEASRRSETSFVQSFTLELPPPERRRAAAETIGPSMPAVAEFVDAAIAAARELSAAAARAGLPQKLSEVELTARIVRANRVAGGIAFTGIGPAGLGGGASRSSDETNTVRLVFKAR